MMNITPELLDRYHQGRCTDAERQLVERWLESGEGEQAMTPLPEVPDEELSGVRMWQRVSGSMQADTPDGPAARIRTGNLKQLIRIAAAIAVVSAAAFLIFRNGEVSGGGALSAATRYDTLTTQPGQRANLRLADGTEVSVNGGSRLIYPTRFGGAERAISLEGEAFFRVAHDERKPFKVTTATSVTEVLGTAFNLTTSVSGAVTLAVTEGKVRFSPLGVQPGDADPLLLGAGQVALLTGSGRLRPLTGDAAHHADWVRKVLSFDDEPIEEVAAKISRWYGVEVIVLGDPAKDLRYTGSYTDPKLKELLNSLGMVLDLKVEMDGNTVTMR